MYRELIETHISNRGKIVDAGTIFPTPSDFTRYCSHFMFGPEILAHLKTHKNEKGEPTVAGFRGKVYCEAVWIDVDCGSDVNAARLSALEVVRRLSAEYQIDPEHLIIYFSGNKGFHIAIHNTLVGFTHSTAIDPLKVKDFVRRLTNGINHIDYVIYDHVRILRIENSRHEKSGLYKIRISFDELQCDIEDIQALARQPRKYPHPFDFQGIRLNTPLNSLWVNSGAYVQEVREADGNTNFFAAPKEGNRNNMLLRQATVLFRKSELSNNAVLDIIRNAAELANAGSADPIPDREIRTIVANAERLVGEDRKKPVADEIQVKSFGEWLPEWETYVLQQSSDMTLGFHDLNQLMKGRLKGKLGVIMGYGGSKKSLYSLNVCLRNMAGQDNISIYSTMEMSVPQLMDRIIDFEVKYEGANASGIVADMYKKDVNQGRKFLTELATEMGHRLQISPNSRMTYKGYKQMIKKVRETSGNPSILIVDGLSMMGGSGTETENYSRNSAELKELSIEENLFVVLICHVAKGEEKHTRDLSQKIRGSEKILDNCDFYMTMSQIQDQGEPHLYLPDKGYVHFVDKRGSGKTVELVYNFEPTRLRLVDSPEPASLYREPVNGGRKGKSDLDY
jgi:hypothetical protein